MRRRRPVFSCARFVAATALCLALAPTPRALATEAPGWSISSIARPTSFSLTDNEFCRSSEAAHICDTFLLTVTNIGSATASEPIVISDALPLGLKAVNVSGYDLKTEGQLGCNSPSAPVRCEYTGSVPVGDALIIEVEVEVVSASGAVTNSATVSGGGAQPATTSPPLTVPTRISESPESFGISNFGMEAYTATGTADDRAGDHPYGIATMLHVNTNILTAFEGERRATVAQQLKDVAVDLPLGLVGDPRAAAQCTDTELVGKSSETETLCPPASRVGTAVVYTEGGPGGKNDVSGTASMRATAIYNMVPTAGYPAQFGVKVLDVPVPLYANVVHTPSGYALRVVTPGVPLTIGVQGVALTFFGDPQAADGSTSSPQAFFTNPADCAAGPVKARIEADSWADPGHWYSTPEDSTAYPQITGCNLLQFEPTTEMHPEVTQAEVPSGYQIKINLRQAPELAPILATPQLKNVTMTLPEGMTLSPGAGDGLQGCEATGPNGIDMPTNLPNGTPRTPTEAGEGEAIGPDGMSHLTAGHCPHQSQIGTVELVTPVLNTPLQGRLYVAQPKCGGPNNLPPCTPADATNGNLFGLYLEAEGSGVVVKLAGSASIDPSTGRITARFLENPQLPVSEVTLNLKGGARAPLANPRQCGPASSNSDLTPWSAPETPDAIISSAPFQVVWTASGEPAAPCPTTLPFAPTLLAGPTNVRAGAFGSFTLTVGRGDRQQDIARVQVHTPPGLLGMLSKVGLCGEGQANEGTCEAASELGSVNVAAGSGTHPLWVTGKVYLTGPYEGAPFGLSAVVPAVAGPFNLGNVIVRSRIDIDPLTSAVTITTDPLPRFKDGIPLRIQTLNVAVTREGFLFNPTHCTGLQVATSIDAAQGASVSLTSPMSLEGCARLPFQPTFKASTAGKTSKAKGASLAVTVTSTPGQANVGGVVVKLPKQLPARLTTLQQACTETVFAQNPAACPAASVVGSAKAVTPILSNAVVGPVYLVSHGGAAFPDVVVILQGEGVRVDLVGNTDIKKQITTSTFAAVPDAPISSFAITLPEGPNSALTSNLPAKAKGNVCGTKLVMPTTITGQNGARIEQSTKIAVLGCPKVRKKTKAKKK